MPKFVDMPNFGMAYFDCQPSRPTTRQGYAASGDRGGLVWLGVGDREQGGLRAGGQLPGAGDSVQGVIDERTVM